MPVTYYIEKLERKRTCIQCKCEVSCGTFGFATQKEFFGVMGSKLYTHLECVNKSSVLQVIKDGYKTLNGFDQLSSGDQDMVKQIFEDIENDVIIPGKKASKKENHQLVHVKKLL